MDIKYYETGVHVLCDRSKGYMDFGLPGYSKEQAYEYLQSNKNIGGVVALAVVRFHY